MDAPKTIKLLAFRFSALGDVAMTIPVLWSLNKHYPNVKVTLVSRSFAKSLIERLPGVDFVEFDPNGKHNGFFGILTLFKELRQFDKWDGVVDLHNVLRTRLLRVLFRLYGHKVVCIDKGREEKKALTRRKNKKRSPLKHTIYRYSETFKKLGLGIDIAIDFRSLVSKPVPLHESIISLTGNSDGKWIGIAPFAKHKGKAYPLDRIKQIIEVLTGIHKVTILLFGAKGEEQRILNDMGGEYDNVKNLAGTLSLNEELDVMSNLHAMISMDSANMHLATLVGIPVISIWGATHPFAGFYGWNQDPNNAIQVELDCRPCSVFGNKPCFRKDYACLNRINPGVIVKKVFDTLNG